MKSLSRLYRIISDYVIWLGLVLSVFYWLLDAFIQSYLFSGGNLSELIFHPDSQSIWMRILVSFILIISSAVMQSVINKRNKAEGAMKESMQFLQLVLDTIPVRVFWKTPDLYYLGCNRLFARDAGLESPEEIVGKNDYQLGWKEQAELYRADDRQVFKTRIPKLSFEEPQTTPDGRRIWLNTSKVPLTDPSGKTVGILGTYEEISNRKIWEEALRERELLLEATLEVSDDGIVVVDDKGQIKAANNRLVEFWGIPRELVEEKDTDKIMKFVLPQMENAESFLERIHQSRGTNFNITEMIRMKDGRVFEAHARPLLKDKKVIGRVWVFHDNTPRLQGEDTARSFSRHPAAQ